jgi:acyl-CoA thioester hydrolase
VPDPSNASPSIGLEIWRGGVNAWECDEMGHMNVRYYAARMMEGLAGLAAHLGMPDAFTPHTESTLIPRSHHFRFLKEAKAGTPLHMTGGVVRWDLQGATVLQTLWHSRTGEPAATVLTDVLHVRPRDGRAFPWPSRAKAAAESLSVEVPAFAAPRSVNGGGCAPVEALTSQALARLTPIGSGVITPDQVDVFGRMRAEQFIGRVSDGVSALLAGVRERVAQASPTEEGPRRIGGAVLEYRLAYLDWPRCGDHVRLCSGLAGFEDKTQRIGHWMIDPINGAPWAFAEAVAVNFDLDTRKAATIPAAAKAILSDHVRPDLRFVE